jgi:branched-chain amino acid transport system ATP-binding protein
MRHLTIRRQRSSPARACRVFHDAHNRQYFQLIYGLLIMGLVLFLPAGLVSLATRRGGVSPEPKPILNVAKLIKRFVYALDGLSFHVASGEILGLVGPNGSGKTTAINVISGLYAPDGGEVTLDGISIGGVASHRLVHRGINRTFQMPKPFLSLTVRENIQVALSYGRAEVTPPTMSELLEEYRLAEAANRPGADLNSAQQKMLDLTRALATRPRPLLLDELAAGLNSAELDWIAGRIKALAATGMAVIVVEHLMGFIEHITDRIIVLNAGKEIFEGKLAAAVKEPQVIEVFLGGEHAA